MAKASQWFGEGGVACMDHWLAVGTTLQRKLVSTWMLCMGCLVFLGCSGGGTMSSERDSGPRETLAAITVALQGNDMDGFRSYLSRPSLELLNQDKGKTGFDIDCLARFLRLELPLKSVEESRTDGKAILKGVAQSGTMMKLSMVQESKVWKLDVVDDIEQWRKFEHWTREVERKMKKSNPLP